MTQFAAKDEQDRENALVKNGRPDLLEDQGRTGQREVRTHRPNVFLQRGKRPPSPPLAGRGQVGGDRRAGPVVEIGRPRVFRPGELRQVHHPFPGESVDDPRGVRGKILTRRHSLPLHLPPDRSFESGTGVPAGQPGIGEKISGTPSADAEEGAATRGKRTCRPLRTAATAPPADRGRRNPPRAVRSLSARATRKSGSPFLPNFASITRSTFSDLAVHEADRLDVRVEPGPGGIR